MRTTMPGEFTAAGFRPVADGPYATTLSPVRLRRWSRRDRASGRRLQERRFSSWQPDLPFALAFRR